MSVSLINGHIDDDAMTDEQIIKALECCSKITFSCDGCPLQHLKYSECYELVIRSTLDLITRKNAEIERLEGLVTDSFTDKIMMPMMIETAKAEAVKEFAERLDESLCKNIGPSRNLYWKISADIDNLVKEMVGE